MNLTHNSAPGFAILSFFAALLVAPGAALGWQRIPPTRVDDFTGHPRLIVISDIGNEPGQTDMSSRLGIDRQNAALSRRL